MNLYQIVKPKPKKLSSSSIPESASSQRTSSKNSVKTSGFTDKRYFSRIRGNMNFTGPGGLTAKASYITD